MVTDVEAGFVGVLLVVGRRKAAERTVKRALARGDRTDMVLVQLVPVGARELHLSAGGAA